jgi:hypothetical protein
MEPDTKEDDMSPNILYCSGLSTPSLQTAFDLSVSSMEELKLSPCEELSGNV